MAGPVHYEVYVRKTAPAPWSLQLATEDRAHAIETAEELLADNRAAAVRVTKETLDPDTMAFNSLTVLTRGAPETPRKRVVADDEAGPRCGSPS
jgi:transcription elongation GreA/GreB family factor